MEGNRTGLIAPRALRRLRSGWPTQGNGADGAAGKGDGLRAGPVDVVLAVHTHPGCWMRATRPMSLA